MIDTEFEKRGRAMSEKLNTIQPIPEVDTEYTWLQEQTPSEAETLRAELQFQRQQVQDVAKVAEHYRALVQDARDERDALTGRLCEKHQIEFDAMTISEKVAKYKECIGHVIDERDAAISDARLLAFAVQTGQRVDGLFEAASKYYVSQTQAQEYKKPEK